jgi:hypothetical protein
MSEKKKEVIPLSKIFNARELQPGDVIDYDYGVRAAVNPYAPLQEKENGFYRGTILGFADNNMVVVQYDKDAPIYCVYNGRYRTNIMRVVQEKK